MKFLMDVKAFEADLSELKNIREIIKSLELKNVSSMKHVEIKRINR
jgi:hypothetical protein